MTVSPVTWSPDVRSVLRIRSSASMRNQSETECVKLLMEPNQKVCTRCLECKPLEDFHKSSRRLDGRTSHCKMCRGAAAKVALASAQRIEEPTVSEKTCGKCSALKPASEFRRRKLSPDGLQHWCRECQLKVQAENPELNTKYQRNWRKRDPERARKVKGRSWQKWYLKQPAGSRAEALREWIAANPEKNALNSLRGSGERRARKAGRDSRKVTAQELRRIREGECVWCGSREDIHVDHVIPLSRGGRHAIGNLQPLCAFHNMSKGDSLWVEWRYRMLSNAALAESA